MRRRWYHHHYFCGLLFALAIVAVVSGEEEEEAWDLRTQYPRCAAWRPYDQGACSSCCAHAVAAALGARACLNDGFNLRLSAAQLWDCGGTASCDAGGSLIGLIDTVGSGDTAGVALLPEACSNSSAPLRDPNASVCYARQAQCAETPRVLQSALFMDFVMFLASSPPSTTADAMLMIELRKNGPVVSVLTLRGDDIAAFFAVRSAEVVFDPRATAWQPLKRHCIMVYGWGVAADGTRFWRVQNSLGVAWGGGGVGRVVRGRGVLETQWRAPTLAPRACAGECVPGYGNFSVHHLSTPVVVAATTTTPAPDGYYEEEEGLSVGSIVGISLGGVLVLVVITVVAAMHPPRAGVSSRGHHHYYGYQDFAGRNLV